MVKNEDYSKIKAIFSEMPEVDIHPNSGESFHFPVFLTETMLNTDIEVLELSVRSVNCLRRAGIHTIGELCSSIRSSSDLKRIRNCGKTSVAEIMDNLFAYQCSVIQPEKRDKYLREVIEMNVNIIPPKVKK